MEKWDVIAKLINKKLSELKTIDYGTWDTDLDDQEPAQKIEVVEADVDYLVPKRKVTVHAKVKKDGTKYTIDADHSWDDSSNSITITPDLGISDVDVDLDLDKYPLKLLICLEYRLEFKSKGKRQCIVLTAAWSLI